MLFFPRESPGITPHTSCQFGAHAPQGRWNRESRLSLGRLIDALYALFRIDDPEVLCDLELAILRLGYVHVHSNMMLTGNHFSRAARPLRDFCVVQCFDNIILL